MPELELLELDDDELELSLDDDDDVLLDEELDDLCDKFKRKIRFRWISLKEFL